jgi:hypothetical protein
MFVFHIFDLCSTEQHRVLLSGTLPFFLPRTSTIVHIFLLTMKLIRRKKPHQYSMINDNLQN